MPEKFGNTVMKALINSPLYWLMGEGFAVITLTGCKTGKTISTPINVVREGKIYTVVSSRERTWWKNLRGGAFAKLRVAVKTLTVQAEVIETMEGVQEALRQYLQARSMMAKYFHVRLTADGSLDARDLQQAAGERVVIQLRDTL